mgnify:CR=1 FL=1
MCTLGPIWITTIAYTFSSPFWNQAGIDVSEKENNWHPWYLGKTIIHNSSLFRLFLQSQINYSHLNGGNLHYFCSFKDSKDILQSYLGLRLLSNLFSVTQVDSGIALWSVLCLVWLLHGLREGRLRPLDLLHPIRPLMKYLGRECPKPPRPCRL